MRGLTKSTARLEVLLKVVVTPDVGFAALACPFSLVDRVTDIQDPPEGFILNYTLLIGDSSFSNFQKVIALVLALHSID
jgi:vacuolar protein sorting-associated protein 53